MFTSKKIPIFVVTFYLAIVIASARVLYFDAPQRNHYSVHPGQDDMEQASKDLDMTFSAGGDYIENDAANQFRSPSKKVLVYPPTDRPVYTVNRDLEAPIVYSTPGLISRKIIYEPTYFHPDISYRTSKLNNNPHKGEVVLELRVIANNNNDN